MILRRQSDHRRGRLIVGLGLAVLLIAAGGCTRAHYRRQADQQAYCLVDKAGCDPRWRLDDYSIKPSPESRFDDPNCPDRPPMPPDDPTSHKLMKCVDCKPGWAGWDKCYGKTRCVANPGWKRFLPHDDKGNVLLDRQSAVQMALVNSPDYQFVLEALYLSALDVSFQRFRFDVQFFGGNSTFFTAEGRNFNGNNGQSQSTLDVENTLRMQKLLAGGGEFMVGLANSFVWQFAGPDSYNTNTLLDFSLVQPLLRGAGRAVVLENLTQSERTLLANVRQMERFREAFYMLVVAGRTPGPGPRRGLLGVNDLLPPAPPATAGGLYTILADDIRIRNQRLNIAQLRKSLRRFEEFSRADRVDPFQVDFTRQALYNAQSRLLALLAAYDDRLDSYKVNLGLPPDLKIRADDTLLDRFNLLDPKVTATLTAIEEQMDTLRALPEADGKAAGVDLPKMAASAREKATAMLKIIRSDLAALEKAVPRRRADLKRLATRPEIAQGDVDPSAVSITDFDQRVVLINKDFTEKSRQFQLVLSALETFPTDSPAAEAVYAKTRPLDTSAEARLVALLSRLSTDLTELSLVEARARLEAATLVPVTLDPNEALHIACANRLDWMNARAALVDVWRQIEVAANALRGNLNVVFSGDMGTLGNNPVRFRGTTGRLRVGVQFEAPLTRLVERNAYVEALIEYERARRDYLAYEDRVNQNLRDNLRVMTTAQLDFELRRAGVTVAIRQVEQSTLKLEEPPKPANPGQAAVPAVLGPTAARDLIGAYSGLLTALNDFVNQWIDYETQRLNLDLELGTMQLDCHGMWIDPGPIEADSADKLQQPEQIPLPEPLPLATALKLRKNGDASIH